MVLVGRSDGGAVVTVAGAAPDVGALVCAAALRPDQGQSAADLNASMAGVLDPGAPILDAAGRLSIARDRSAGLVSADLPPEDSAFLAASQVGSRAAILMEALPAAARRDKPTCGIVAAEDRSVTLNLRCMHACSGAQVTEVEASRVAHMSPPGPVAAAIEKAARAVE